MPRALRVGLMVGVVVAGTLPVAGVHAAPYRTPRINRPSLAAPAASSAARGEPAAVQARGRDANSAPLLGAELGAAVGYARHGGVLTGGVGNLEGWLRVGPYFAVGAFASAGGVSTSGVDAQRYEYSIERSALTIGGTLRGALPLGKLWEPQLFVNIGYAWVNESSSRVYYSYSGYGPMRDGAALDLGGALSYQVVPRTWLALRLAAGVVVSGGNDVLGWSAQAAQSPPAESGGVVFDDDGGHVSVSAAVSHRW